MPYCRSCGVYMDAAATVCSTCGAAVAATPVAVGAAAPTLIATFNATTGWLGKTITYAAGRFILEGYGEVTAKDVLAYDARGQLDWASGGMRDWVEQLKTSPHGAAMSLVESQSTASVPRTARPTAPMTLLGRVALMVLVLVLVTTWILSGMHSSQRFAASPAGLVAMWALFVFFLVQSYVKRR